MEQSPDPAVIETQEDPSIQAELLTQKIRKILSQIEHSEQSLHVRLRTEFQDFLKAYEEKTDYTEALGRIRISLQVAVIEVSLKKGHLDEAKALALAGHRANTAVPAFIFSLARIAVAEQKYDDALLLYKEALAKGMSSSIVNNNLALMYQTMGRFDEADKIWAEGFPEGYVTYRSYTGPPTDEPLRVLIVTSPLVGNIRYRLFMHRTELDMTMLCADSFVSDDIPLPEHDILFCSIGDADLCAHSLTRAKRIFAKSSAPLINHPALVELTSRELISQRLAKLEGVKTAQIERFSKEELTQAEGPEILARHGFSYPLLLRSPGFQNGSHFEMVGNPQLLADTAKKLPKDDILVLSYLDTRAEDGTVRKIRVMRINSVLYPIHLAVSHGWKVHYHSSSMEEYAIFRAEEQRFLEDMPGFLGQNVIKTLERIFDTLNLDYAGIDFSVDHEGQVAVYEANATMAILTPGADPKWDYRRAPLATALTAASTMFYDRAAVRVPLKHAA